MRAALVVLLAATAFGQDLGRPRHNNSYVPDDDETLATMVAEARQAAADGSAAIAADRLQALLLTPRAGVVPLKARVLFTSPRRWAQIHLLSETPPFGPEVLAAWRKSHDSKASAALRAAILSGDEPEMRQLLDRYPAATAAPVALLALCDRALQRGDPDSARGFLLRVPEHVERSREQAWLASKAIRERHKHLDALPPRRPPGWPTVGGDWTRARNGDPVAGPAEFGPLWEGLFLDGVPDSIAYPDPDREHSPILAFTAVCDATHLYVHTGAAVAALDRKSGKLAFWAPEGAEPKVHNVDELLLQNPGVRSASIADGILYFNRVLFFGRDERPRPRRYNELVAFEVSTRRTLWRVGGQRGPYGKSVFFRGAPAVVGERLYVYGAARDHGADGAARKEEAHLYCFDKATGRPLWHHFLGYGDTDASPEFPPLSGLAPAVGAGVVVVVSGLGVAAALDAQSGDLLWLFRYDRQPVRERERLQEVNEDKRVHLRSGWMREPPRIVGDTVYFAPFDADEMYACWLRGARQPTQTFEIEQWPKDRSRGHRHSLLEYVGGMAGTRIYYVGRRDPRPSLTVSYQAVVSHPLDRAVEMGYGLMPALERDERTGKAVPPELYGRPAIAGTVLLVPTRQTVFRFDLGGAPTTRLANGERRTEIPLLQPYFAPPRQLKKGEPRPPAFGNLIAVDGFLYAVTGDRVVCYAPKK